MGKSVQHAKLMLNAFSSQGSDVQILLELLDIFCCISYNEQWSTAPLPSTGGEVCLMLLIAG